MFLCSPHMHSVLSACSPCGFGVLSCSLYSLCSHSNNRAFLVNPNPYLYTCFLGESMWLISLSVCILGVSRCFLGDSMCFFDVEICVFLVCPCVVLEYTCVFWCVLVFSWCIHVFSLLIHVFS